MDQFTNEPDGSIVVRQRVRSDKSLSIRSRVLDAIGASRSDMVEMRIRIVEKYKET